MGGLPLRYGCLLVFCAAVLATGCQPDDDATTSSPGPVVLVTTPLVRQVTDYAYFTGRTEAVESVNVQSRVTGYLKSIDFVPGAEIKAGEQLFLIDPRPYQAVLDQAQGQVDLAAAQLKLAVADFARAQALAETPGAISQQDIDKYAAAQVEAEAALAAAKANAEEARLNVEFTRVLSPIDGLVGRNLLTLGNLIKQDQTTLTTVVSQDPMYAYFDLDEHTMLRIERLVQESKVVANTKTDSLAVEMGLADEGNRFPHQGHIDFINNRMDPATGTLQVRGVFSNPLLGYRQVRLLTPGLFVRIRLPIGPPHDAMLVPEAAIGTDQGKKYLLVVNSQGEIEYRPVELGSKQGDALQVVLPVPMVHTDKGLRAAGDLASDDRKMVPSISTKDRILVSGLQRVRPGMKVQPRMVDDPAAPASHVEDTPANLATPDPAGN